eukprot:3893962-Pyramimonas_sp.AAC.1
MSVAPACSQHGAAKGEAAQLGRFSGQRRLDAEVNGALGGVFFQQCDCALEEYVSNQGDGYVFVSAVRS